MPIVDQPQCGVGPYQNNLDVLKEIVNDGLPVVHVFPYKLACMSYLLFDIEELFVDEASASTELQLKIKMLGNGKYEHVMTDDNCGMAWWEEIHTFDKTTVVADVINSTTVELTDITVLKGIGVNSQIRFQTTTAPGTANSPVTKKAIVVGIAGNIVTLNAPITLDAGDAAYRGSNLRLRCGTIANQYTLNKRNKYISYFQSLHGELVFETCELSADRAVYNMNGGKSPQVLVNAKMNALFEGLLQVEFIDAFLYGSNVAQDDSTNTASQTRGLITSIQDAQVCNNKPYIIDLFDVIGQGCNDVTCDDGKVISIMIEYFIKAFESGYYNNEQFSLQSTLHS